MPDSYSGLQLANGRVRLASWRLPYSEPEILANRRDQTLGVVLALCTCDSLIVVMLAFVQRLYRFLFAENKVFLL